MQEVEFATGYRKDQKLTKSESVKTWPHARDSLKATKQILYLN